MAPASPAPKPAAPAMRQAGTLELLADLGGGALFVGGWCDAAPAPGAGALLLLREEAGTRVLPGRFHAGWRDRPDTGPATGFYGIVDCGEVPDPGAIEGLLFPAEAGPSALLPRYASAQLLSEGTAVNLLREILDAGRAGEARARLGRAASRFDGTDTLARSPLPVRVGIDECARLGAAGLYLSGWLFDPERLVASVHLCEGEARRRLDGDWAILPRPDAAEALGDEPRLAAYGAPGAVHGFVALVPEPGAGGDELHLTLDMAGAPPLHVPLVVRPGRAVPLLRAALRRLDPDLPASLDVVDRQVAPALARLPGAVPRLIGMRGGEAAPEALATLVIGCAGDAEGVAPLLALLAADDPALALLPILVCGEARDLGVQAGDIERASAFYGLNLRLVFASDLEDATDALMAGAQWAETELVCLLTPRVVPATPRWLSVLIAARAAAGAEAVLPALDDAEPGITIPAALGRRASDRGENRRLDGCLVARARLLSLGSAQGAFLDPDEKERDTIRRLLAGGLGLHRTPAVRLATTRESGAAGPWMRLARRADRRAGELRTLARPSVSVR
ncbi:hypothetical protein [Aureimonas sp. AU20]|uniref:hypothetical protein n=1 Tax=Aureimonas sp. AU20 TaxID=1349819 RepID=UPI000722CF15|nr:hypothetical protein [Aureimonas sp. AU20]ALN72202.1 hypothetical protein M673_05710 [Aureimonas sp. AU20]